MSAIRGILKLTRLQTWNVFLNPLLLHLNLSNGSREIDHLHRASQPEQKTKFGADQSGAKHKMAQSY